MKCTEHGKVIPHYRCGESERWLDERTPQGATDCERCALLRKEAKFRHEMQLLASDTAAGLADLNDHDQRVDSLRSLLSKEIERRRAAELRADRLEYQLQVATGRQA
jgi:hypothetical protein